MWSGAIGVKVPAPQEQRTRRLRFYFRPLAVVLIGKLQVASVRIPARSTDKVCYEIYGSHTISFLLD